MSTDIDDRSHSLLSRSRNAKGRPRIFYSHQPTVRNPGHVTMSDQERYSSSSDSTSSSSFRVEVDDDPQGLDNSISSYPKRSQQPLIHFVKNSWMSANSRYSRSKPGGTSSEKDPPSTIDCLFSLVAAPRIRRYIVVYLCLLCLCLVSWFGWVSPKIKEYDALSRSIDPLFRDSIGGWFGSNVLPKFTDLVYVRSLDPSHLPSPTELTEFDPNRKRLVIVGDVHGCLEERE